MAKRAAPDEKPFRPLLDANLVSAALADASSPVSSPSTQIPRPTLRTVEDSTPLGQGVSTGTREISRNGLPAIEKRFEPLNATVKAFTETFDSEKRILFTRSETQAIDRLVTSFARRVNTQVKVSHVVRALVLLLLNAEGEIDTRAGEAPPLVRPPNGDAHALQRFEKEIASIIGAALRDSPPLRTHE